MKLCIKFEKNGWFEYFIKNKNIPCICKIKGNDFSVEFFSPLPEAVGTVKDFSKEEINLRAPSYGGGVHTHNSFAEISLIEVSQDIYEISDLRFFYQISGWHQILENFSLVEVVDEDLPDWVKDLDKGKI